MEYNHTHGQVFHSVIVVCVCVYVLVCVMALSALCDMGQELLPGEGGGILPKQLKTINYGVQKKATT